MSLPWNFQLLAVTVAGFRSLKQKVKLIQLSGSSNWFRNIQNTYHCHFTIMPTKRSLFTLSAKKETNIHTSRSYIHCNYSCIEKLVPKRSQCFLLNRVSVCVTMYSIQAKVTSNFGLQAFELNFFAIFAWLHGTSM